ncbi:cation transporter [Sphingomonas piscis]|uniref:Cation transporter n=1 Tax=Sphingomonas piscis TaxID=2714943 RepID=A0A6G7YR26_9SPHN|nr:cation diffusion facilitator family transporter [Sphingomonas piscis]QIK79184.1 cation transporter [Sphingomonas piscis]
MSGSHSHDHDHGHGHSHAPADFGRAFAIGIALNLAFVVIETVYGFLADSVALVADAGHNLSDVLGLIVAWAGATMARRERSARFTFGWKKASILAALVNSLFLILAVGAIAAEAVRRLFEPATPDGPTVMAVAAVGILVNGITALLFARGRTHDINVRAAFQHMLADAGVSAAVVFSGALILWTGQQWVDPVMSLAIAVVILWGSIGLLKESVWMSLAGVPSGIEIDEVEDALEQLEGVRGVHHLHIWPLSTTETALTAHLIVPAGHSDRLLEQARTMLHDRFHIDHSTIQVERGADADCDDC